MSSASPSPGLSVATRILLALAAAVIVLAGLSLARDILGPALLAAVIVIICLPVGTALRSRGRPAWVATLAIIATAYLVLAALAAMLWYAGVQFTRLLSESAEQLRETAEGILGWLWGMGWETQAADAVASLLDPATLAGAAASVGTTVLGVLTAFFFVLAYVIFVAIDAARYARAEHAFGKAAAPVVARFRAFNAGIRRYYVVNASFGLVVARVRPVPWPR